MDRGQRPGCPWVLSHPALSSPLGAPMWDPGCPCVSVSVGAVIRVIPTWLKQLPDWALGPLPAPALITGHTHLRGTPGAGPKVGDGRVCLPGGLSPHRRSGSPADTLSLPACPRVLSVWEVEMGANPLGPWRPLPAQGPNLLATCPPLSFPWPRGTPEWSLCGF